MTRRCVMLVAVAAFWRDCKLQRRTTQQVSAVLSASAVQTAFQPILAVATGQVVGVEALARFPGQPARGPAQWFADAVSVGLGVELELVCMRSALVAAMQLDVRLGVSLNISPVAALDPRTATVLLESGIAPGRITIEITEHDAVVDYETLRVAISHLRHHGIRLAIDDVGAGYSSFAHILALAPNSIKIDRQIIAAIDREPGRRALVRAIVGFATELSITVVAEGVETEVELTGIERLGVDLVQGYLTGRPVTDPASWASWASHQTARPTTIRHRAIDELSDNKDEDFGAVRPGWPQRWQNKVTLYPDYQKIESADHGYFPPAHRSAHSAEGRIDIGHGADLADAAAVGYSAT